LFWKQTFFLLVFLLFTQHLCAEDDVRAPTVFLELGGGLTTYKSKLVTSNDTSISTGYSLGLNGGADKNIGALLRNESNTTNFEYGVNGTTSQIQSNFQDFLLRYRLGFFYLGPVFSQTAFKVKRYGVAYLDTLGSGIGFNGGLMFIVARNSEIFLDYTSTSTSTVKDVVQSSTSKVGIGSRSEIYLGSKIPITRSVLNFFFGYKQRTYSISVSGQNSSELQTTTWVGLALKDNF
jgi:hypothetical protein